MLHIPNLEWRLW